MSVSTRSRLRLLWCQFEWTADQPAALKAGKRRTAPAALNAPDRRRRQSPTRCRPSGSCSAASTSAGAVVPALGAGAMVFCAAAAMARRAPDERFRTANDRGDRPGRSCDPGPGGHAPRRPTRCARWPGASTSTALTVATALLDVHHRPPRQRTGRRRVPRLCRRGSRDSLRRGHGTGRERAVVCRRGSVVGRLPRPGERIERHAAGRARHRRAGRDPVCRRRDPAVFRAAADSVVPAAAVLRVPLPGGDRCSDAGPGCTCGGRLDRAACSTVGCYRSTAQVRRRPSQSRRMAELTLRPAPNRSQRRRQDEN